MNIAEIPLTADNQRFDITLANVSYQMRILWRADRWFLDLQDSRGSDIIAGLPLVTGTNLLEPYRWLQPGFALVVLSDLPESPAPGQFDLGDSSHLCVIMEAT